MIFRIVIPCTLEKARHFGGVYHLHLQGRRVSHAKGSKLNEPNWARRLFLLVSFPSGLYGGTSQKTIYFNKKTGVLTTP
jgi:hypothetical protein